MPTFLLDSNFLLDSLHERTQYCVVIIFFVNNGAGVKTFKTTYDASEKAMKIYDRHYDVKKSSICVVVYIYLYILRLPFSSLLFSLLSLPLLLSNNTMRY